MRMMSKKKKAWVRRYLKRQKQINDWAREQLCPKMREDVIEVFHPDESRRWFRQGPCAECPVKGFCDTPCRAYLHWYDHRINLARQLLF